MYSASKNKLRLFIGLACPPAAAIRSLLNELAISARDCPDLNIVPEANLHITLKFIGSTQQQQVPALLAMMRHYASLSSAFSLQMQGAGSFSNALWLGVKPSDALRHLVERLDAGAAALGYDQEEKCFVPHVTVARLGRHCAFDREAWLETNRHKDWQEFSVTGINLYRSDSDRKGSRYTIVDSAAFSAARPVD